MATLLEYLALMWDWFDNQPLPLRTWNTLTTAWYLARLEWH